MQNEYFMHAQSVNFLMSPANAAGPIICMTAWGDTTLTEAFFCETYMTKSEVQLRKPENSGSAVQSSEEGPSGN